MSGNMKWFKLMIGSFLMVGILVTIAACQAMDSMGSQPTFTMTKAVPPKDGELSLPADYKAWPKFLVNIDKEQIKQVRNIYINKTGAQTMGGKEFPNGTMMVMEIYKAQAKTDGSVEKTVEGQLIKGDLAKVFIMGKGDGWGLEVPDNLMNGAWVYSAAGPDGKPMAEDFTKCRACHAPLAKKDFVHRYDEYFEKRGRG